MGVIMDKIQDTYNSYMYVKGNRVDIESDIQRHKEQLVQMERHLVATKKREKDLLWKFRKTQGEWS